MFVYIEYITRREGVSLAHFHSIATRSQGGWAESYSADRLLLNVGRTWRIGPEPEYLAAWYTPDSGLERLGDWERAFASGEADILEKPMELAARLDRAGCYDPLLEPTAHQGGRYYAEFFDFTPEATRETVVEWFRRRRDKHGLILPLLLDRIGTLGPDPRGLAVWALGDYGDLEQLARELTDNEAAPIRVVTSALYAELGEEVL